MSTTPLSAKHHLASEIASVLGEGAGASARDIVELVIRCGWQPRPIPDPNAEYLEGVLDNGTRVPIEIRRAALTRTH